MLLQQLHKVGALLHLSHTDGQLQTKQALHGGLGVCLWCMCVCVFVFVGDTQQEKGQEKEEKEEEDRRR